MQSLQLNREKVKQVTNASKTATHTMILLGFRQRARSVTNVAALKNELIEMGEQPTGRDYMDFWRGLESAGAGSIILGRRGRPTRFEWNYSLIQIAKFAIEGKEEEIKKIASKKRMSVNESDETENSNVVMPIKPAKQMKMVSNQAVKEERLVYKIPVRPGYDLEVSLPSDISNKELEKIKNALVAPESVEESA